jgi:Spy/CpxP family protein refolding chaperone
MKQTWLRFLAIPAIAGGMLLAAAPQGPTQPNPAAQPQGAQRWQKRGDRIARFLNLTDEQRAQFSAEMQSARTAARPFHRELNQVRQEMFQAVRVNNTGRIARLGAKEGALEGRLSAMRHDAFAKIYSELTPDQRAKADQIPAHMRAMRQHRMQNHPAPSNG